MSAMCLPRISERALGFPRISLSLNCTDPGEDGQIVGQQPENAHGGGGFAGAGLADDRDSLAGVDAEGDSVDSADDASCCHELDLQLVDFQ